MAEQFEIEVAGSIVRGLRARPTGTAHARVLALHGGGYDSRYWHHPGHDELSLLSLGQALGFDVVALDRAGYRGSAESWPEGLSLADQIELTFDLIDLGGLADLPLFLIGHSMGGILSLLMATSARGDVLRGIDVSGIPLRYGDERHAMMRTRTDPIIASGASHLPAMSHEHRRAAFFGANGTFDPAVVSGGETEHPVPVAEFFDALNCPETLPAALSRITAPVQWTIPDAENSSEGGLVVLDEAARLLNHSALTKTAIQAGSGHNISLHHVGRAYHLRAFAFFEECLALKPV